VIKLQKLILRKQQKLMRYLVTPIKNQNMTNLDIVLLKVLVALEVVG
jgi:hypothetical protein